MFCLYYFVDLFAFVTSHSVCEIRKIPRIASSWVLASSNRHIKTDIKRIECQIVFLAYIYLFKVNNRKTRKKCKIVQSS